MPFPSVDHFEVVEGFSSIRGATEKDVLCDPATGDLYIAKLGKRHNDLEVMTEYAIHLIGRSIGVVVADARVARYKGQLRFLSKYFLNIQEREELVHGVQLFNDLYDETTIKRTRVTSDAMRRAGSRSQTTWAARRSRIALERPSARWSRVRATRAIGSSGPIEHGGGMKKLIGFILDHVVGRIYHAQFLNPLSPRVVTNE